MIFSLFEKNKSPQKYIGLSKPPFIEHLIKSFVSHFICDSQEQDYISIPVDSIYNWYH